MGLFSKIKNFFSNKEINFEKYSKNKLLNDKWIEHYFLIGFTFPDVPKKEREFILENERRKIFDTVFGQIIRMDNVKKGKNIIYQGSLKKNITILISNIKNVNVFGKKAKYCEFLIRFVDLLPKDKKRLKNQKGSIEFREKKKDKRSYFFSPLESIKLLKLEILPAIEFGLVTRLGIKQNEAKDLFFFLKGKPYFRQFDGIQYFCYPIEKRIELFVKYPEIEEIAFKSIDNDFFFKDFIEKIKSRKNDNEHMRKYVLAVEKILAKYELK